MAKLDAENTRQMVHHFLAETAAYQRQWTLSLGIGCGGAAIALISLAANLPDPNYAFRLFAPSLWIFLVGIASAATSLPVAALRSTNIGVHFSEAFHRDQLPSATTAMPEFITAPKSLGEEAAFLVGVALPLVHISNGGLLAPAESADIPPVATKW